MRKVEVKKQLDEFLRRGRDLSALTIRTLPTYEAETDRRQRITRLLLPNNYGAFWNYYFGSEAGAYLGDANCASFHVQAYSQLYKAPYINQFRMWFRGSGKSLQSNVGNALALKQTKKMKFMLLIGATENHAKRLLSDIQVQLAYNERLIRDFGKQEVYGNWTDGAFETKDGCYFMALGINQPFRGLRSNRHRIEYAVLDDIEDRKVALNPKIVQERVEKVSRDLLPAFGKGTQRLVVANNRFVKNGVLDGLITALKLSKYTQIQRVNIVDSKGQPTWKQRWSLTEVNQLKKEQGLFVWQSEYMNSPVERGKTFPKEWIRYVKVARKQASSAIVFWDLSYTTDGDYKACALVAAHKNRMVVMDVFCRKCAVAEAMHAHYDKVRRWTNQGWGMVCYYDATAAQRPVFEPIWMEVMQKEKQTSLPIADHSSNVDKALRIQTTLTK